MDQPSKSVIPDWSGIVKRYEESQQTQSELTNF